MNLITLDAACAASEYGAGLSGHDETATGSSLLTRSGHESGGRVRRRIRLILLVGLSLLAAATAKPVVAEEAEEPLWEVRLAAFGRYGAAYPAADENQFNVIPLPFPIYRGKFLRLGDDSEKPIQGRIFRTDRIQLNIDFNLNFGSDSDDIEVRMDMPDGHAG